ncbi:hypothetical protein KY289_026676 [Solanum tuberosum]|nr:hypothetical protein KY289_026676 [Solanum tuberosum]
MVMFALFVDSVPPSNCSRAAGKRPRSVRISDDAEAKRLRKKEHQRLEEARWALLLEEEVRQQRAREIGVGPSASVNTTEGA